MKKMMLVLVSLLVAGSLFADSASFKKVWDDVVKAQKVTITKSTPIQTYAEVVAADVKAKIKAPDGEKKYGKTVNAVLQNALVGKAKEADVVAAFAKATDVPPTLAAGPKAGIKVVGKDNKLDQKGIDALVAALKAKKLTAAYDAKTDTLTVTE
jgi:hypothetical protein